MREEFMISRQGKQFVLFAGLLDEAHSKGLQKIKTSLIERPNEMNGSVAVVQATVYMEDGREFDGIGDASPENVGRNIAPHVIRMAETRAKARALRDAINVGVTALEELGPDDDSEEKPSSSNKTSNTNRRSPGNSSKSSKGKSSSRNGAKSGGAENPASESQIKYLTSLAEDVHGSLEAYEEDHLDCAVDELTVAEASALIKALQKEKVELEEAMD